MTKCGSKFGRHIRRSLQRDCDPCRRIIEPWPVALGTSLSSGPDQQHALEPRRPVGGHRLRRPNHPPHHRAQPHRGSLVIGGKKSRAPIDRAAGRQAAARTELLPSPSHGGKESVSPAHRLRWRGRPFPRRPETRLRRRSPKAAPRRQPLRGGARHPFH